MYRVYSSDGFQELGSFASRGAAMSAIAEQRWGVFNLEHPSGRIESVPASGESGAIRGRGAGRRPTDEAVIGPTRRDPNTYAISARAASGRRARITELVGPRRDDGSYYYQKPDGRGGSDDGRRGTGHKHPPGPRKCPKCGV